MELDTQMTTQKWIPPWMTFPHQHSFSISNEKGFVSSWLQCAVEERDGNNGEQNCLASLLKNSFFKNNEMELRKGIGAVPKQCYYRAASRSAPILDSEYSGLRALLWSIAINF
jgi:hypothetical protein